MHDGVAVNGFEFSTVDGEIGLAVAVQIQFAQGDAACDRLLEDAGGDAHVVPGYFTWEARVYGNQLHEVPSSSAFGDGPIWGQVRWCVQYLSRKGIGAG